MSSQHNMRAAGWIGVLVTTISILVGALTIPWGRVAEFGTSVNFLYENHAELEHILEDYHDLLSLRAELEDLEKLVNIVTNRDSLLHVLELLDRGKFPYDSLWLKSQSGHPYETTIEEHFDAEHHD